MKVIINSSNAPRREYTNLPEREPNDLIRQRLGEKRVESQFDGDAASVEDNSASERLEFESPEPALTSQPNGDFLTNFLSEGEEDAVIIDDSRSWKHTRWATLVFAGVLLALGGLWYFASHFESGLVTEHITVRGASLLSEKEIISLAGINRKEKFYDVNLKQVQARLMRHSLIKDAHPSRALNPSTIILDIEERQPVAMLRSETTGEAYIIDRDGVLLRPKLISGLRDPTKLMQVPLLTGISEQDTIGYKAMARLIAMMAAIDSGALRSAIGELRRTQAGAFVIYTSETQTPIFIGSPFDAPFRTAMEAQLGGGLAPAQTESLFLRQLRLLAKVWNARLKNELRAGGVAYVDARFSGQVVLKRRQSGSVPASKAIAPKTAIASTTSQKL